MIEERLPLNRPHFNRWRWPLLAVLVLVAALSLVFLPLRQFVESVLHAIQGLGFLGYLVVIGTYVLAALFFVPGSLVTLAAGFLFGVAKGSVVVSIGATLGAAAAFLTARYLARDRVEGKIMSNPRFHAIDRAVGREGFKIVLLTRLAPVFPYNVLNYAFGLTTVSFRRYILASWIGMIPGTLLYVYLGSTAKDLAQIFSGNLKGGIAQQAIRIFGLAATVLVTLVVTRIARRALREAIPQSNTPDR